MLGCKAVKLSPLQRAALTYAEMGGIVRLWRVSQDARAARDRGGGGAVVAPPVAPYPVLHALQRICPVYEYVGDAQDLPGVLCIISAKVSPPTFSQAAAAAAGALASR